MSLASFPPAVSWPGASFPPRGPSGRFPRFHGTMRRSESPATRPAALRCLRLAVSRSHPRFAPVAAGCAGHGPGVGHPVPPAGILPRRWRGLPGSWGTHVHVPCSPTPAGSRRQAIAASRRGLPSLEQRRLPRVQRFRGSITRPAHSLSTLRSPVAPAPRKTRFRLLASSAGRGWLPAGFQRKVSACRFLLSQAFLAH